MNECFIHESAHVSETALIGRDTKIWINSQIRDDAYIGESCNIGKDTYIDFGVKVGDRVKIQNGVSIYHGVTISDDVFIGPNAAFTNDLYPRSFNTEWSVVETFVGKGASIGANATIVCGVTIGSYSMIGAGSVVTKNVPPHALVVGNPAKRIGYVCRCGEKLKTSKCDKCDFILTDQDLNEEL